MQSLKCNTFKFSFIITSQLSVPFQNIFVQMSQCCCISCIWMQAILLKYKQTRCSGQFQFSLQTNAHHGTLCGDSLWLEHVTTSISTA